MSKHGWTYVGQGERYSYGVPTRDLSAEEFARLNPLDQRRVRESGAYTPQKALADMTRDELNAYATAQGVADPETLATKSDLLAALGEKGA